jgi:ubiquinone/menaquinone biosynthesis C-methylase UbiE
VSRDDPTFVKQVNAIFHQLEAEMYDVRHPEITQDEVMLWKENILPVIERLDINTALDIGSGTGFVAGILLENMSYLSTMICYDISERMLTKARHCLRAQFPISLAFALGDAEKLPFADGSIDLVCINSVLHHLPLYANFLRDVDRILPQGGAFVLAHEPNRLFFQRVAGGIALYDLYRLLRKFYPVDERERHHHELFSKTSKYLMSQGITRRDLAPHEIAAIVDYHSPTAGRVDLQRGFVPREILETFFPTYRVVAFRTYRHIGKVRLKNRLTKSWDWLLANLLPQRGMLFSWVLVK